MNTLKKIIDFLVIVIRLFKDCFGFLLMIMLPCTVSSSQPSLNAHPFLSGAFSIPIFVLSTEFSGKRQRSTAGSLVWIGFIVFKMMIPGLAYGIRDWKILTMVSAAPGFLVLAAWL